MAAEKIIILISKDEVTEELATEMKDYLFPLKSSKKQKKKGDDAKDISKYQDFVTKALSTIVKKLPESSHPLLLLKMAEDSVSLFNTSVTNRAPPSNLFYKYNALLIHLSKKSINLLTGDPSLADRAMNVIQSTLQGLYTQLANGVIQQKDDEREALVKGTACVLWNAASKWSSIPSKMERVLNLCRLSIECYFLSPSHISFGLEKALIADKQYRIAINKHNSESQSFLSRFHVSLLTNRHLLLSLEGSSLFDCQAMLHIILWLALGSLPSYDLKNSKEVIKFIDTIQKTLKCHSKTCKSDDHTFIKALVSLHHLATVSIRSQSPQINSFVIRSFHPSLLSTVDLSLLSSNQLISVTELVQFSLLEMKDLLENKQTSPLSVEAFSSLNIILQLCCQCLIRIKSFSISVIRSKQVLPYSILMDILIFSLRQPSYDVKLISHCLPLVESLHDLLKTVQPPLLEDLEEVATYSFNFGLVLYQNKCFTEAVSLLKVSCEEYLYCSKESEDFEQKIIEVKLFMKYSLLVECLVESGEYAVSMSTIEEMLRIIYDNNINNKRIVSICMNQFITCKCHLRNCTKFNQESLLSRSSLDWLQSSSDNKLRLLYLTEELESTQSLMQDTRDWQLSLTLQLLCVSREEKRSHYYAWLRIKQASLCYSLQCTDSQESPSDVLTEAIQLLESLQDSVEYKCKSSDLLGLAYLWRGVFMHSNCMSKSESIMSFKASQDLYDILSASIDHWSNVLKHIDNIRRDSLSVKECFLNFSSTLHHLVLFSSFTNGLLFHKLTLRLLDLIITLSDRFPTASNHELLYQSLAKKSMLLLYEKGLHSISVELKSKLEKVEVMEYSKEQETICVAQLECKLALAAIFVQNGELDDALTLFQVILSHPVLTHSRSFVHHFLSSTGSVLSLFITTSNKPPLKEMKEILSFLLNSKNGRCDYKDCCCDQIRSGSVKSTDFELSFNSLKLTRGLVTLLMSSYSPNSTKTNPSETDEDSVIVPESHLLASPVCKAWEIFSSLLSNLYTTSGQYLSRGLINESLHFAKEGLELAKKLQLLYWTIKFTIHMAKISITSADVATSFEYVQTATTLMGLEKRIIIPSTSKDVKSVGESIPDTVTSNTRSGSRKPQSATKSKSKVDFKPIARATRTPAARRSTRSRLKTCETTTPSHHSATKQSVSVPQSGGIINQLCEGIESLSLGSLITSDHHHQFYVVTLSLVVSQYHLLNKDTSSCLSVLDNTVTEVLSHLREEMGIELILPHEIDSLRLRVRALLDLGSFDEANALTQNKILHSSSLSRWMHLPTIRLPLAGLYYNISNAMIELLPAIVTESIYSNNFRTSSQAEEKTPSVVSQKKRRVRRITDSDDDEEEREGEEKILGSVIPQSLRPVLSYLLLACQFVTPVTLSCSLVRDVYQSMGHVFSVLHVELSAHFFLLSSSVSLEQEAVYWFGRKIRKEKGHNVRGILSEMVSAITAPVTPKIPPPPLVQARSLLHPLPHPLPLDYTRNMRHGLPQDWVYCLCTVTERTGGKRVLVIIRIKNNQDPIVVKIPLGATTQSGDGVTCDELESKFNNLMNESVSTGEITDRTLWWSERMKLDKQLQDFVVKLESVWLGHWKLLLLPTPLSSSSLSSLSSLLSTNGVSSSNAWAEVLVAGKKTLGHREFDLVLSSLLDKRKINKGEIEKAIEDCARHKNTTTSPVILSLSKSLHPFPFENIPLLRNQLVTRIPSLQFLSAGLTLHTEREQSGINPSNTYYVVNPSGDLKKTQEVFADWFEKEVGWTGVIGRRPSTDEFISGLKDHDTFIYCGHGNGREYLGKHQKLQDLHTTATVLQMGCSSGKLKSVGDLDPHGMAHNFLIAGCPFLVGNLWTVTDGDIDRFCTALVKKGLSTKRKQKTTHDELLCSLTEARDSCKLKYLIGASPVVYGLPLTK